MRFKQFISERALLESEWISFDSVPFREERALRTAFFNVMKGATVTIGDVLQFRCRGEVFTPRSDLRAREKEVEGIIEGAGELKITKSTKKIYAARGEPESLRVGDVISGIVFSGTRQVRVEKLPPVSDVIKRFLELYRFAIKSPSQAVIEVEHLRQLVPLLRRAGIKGTELDIIEKSVEAEQARLDRE
jgi:hypothetical protein